MDFFQGSEKQVWGKHVCFSLAIKKLGTRDVYGHRVVVKDSSTKNSISAGFLLDRKFGRVIVFGYAFFTIWPMALRSIQVQPFG